jgi:hypothetical protein
MSYQYPYPQYPGQYPPQQPGPGITPPPTDQPPTPTYVPLNLPDTSPAYVQSQQAINIAAGKDPAEFGVKVYPPVDFPLAMYNQQKRETKAAKDQEEKLKLASQGFTETPYPAENPNAVTGEMLQALQDVWTKAGDALRKLTQLVDQQQKQIEAASGILQQQPPQPGYPYAPPGD